MTNEFFAAESKWWRWSDYAIRDGYICPAPGAKLESFPVWELYERSKSRYDDPPYMSLLKLLEKMPPGVGLHEHPNFRTGRDARKLAEFREMIEESNARVREAKRKREATGARPPGGTNSEPGRLDLLRAFEQEVLSWCRKHGLLGILLTDTLALRLPKERSRFPEITRSKLLGQRYCVWAGRGWEERFVVAQSMPPAVLLRTKGKWIEESLGTTWGKFFPSVPPAKRDSFQYPLPLSEAFWKLYAEPVGHFVSATITFRNAVDAISKPEEELPARNALEVLHSLTATVHPIIVYMKDKTWEQTWVAPSLLSTFAMVALLDRVEGCRVLRCVTCKKVVWTKNPRRRYCDSAQCRWASQKRRQRGKPEDETPRRGRPRKEASSPTSDQKG